MIQILLFEFKQRMRRKGDMAASLLFFILSFSLFPFALGPDPGLLATLAPGIVWVALMFSVQISLLHLFAEDFTDGNLELMYLQGSPFEAGLTGKLFVFWAVTSLPLILMTPLAAVTFSLDVKTGLILTLSIFLGTVSLCMIGAVTAALALGSRNASLVVPLLTLPLSIPVLIFGVATVEAVINGFSPDRILLVLLGLSLLYLPAGILGCSLVLRQVLKL